MMTATTETYQGWKNYETFCVDLWLSNEEPSYLATLEMAEEAKDVIDLADALKNMLEEDAPDLAASVYGDLLNAAMSEVDWYELAEHWLEKDARD